MYLEAASEATDVELSSADFGGHVTVLDKVVWVTVAVMTSSSLRPEVVETGVGGADGEEGVSMMTCSAATSSPDSLVETSSILSSCNWLDGLILTLPLKAAQPV